MRAAAIESSDSTAGIRRIDGGREVPRRGLAIARRAHDGRAATCSLKSWSWHGAPCAGSGRSTPTRLSLIVWSRNSFVWRCRLSWRVVVIFMSRGDELLRYYFAESVTRLLAYICAGGLKSDSAIALAYDAIEKAKKSCKGPPKNAPERKPGKPVGDGTPDNPTSCAGDADPDLVPKKCTPTQLGLLRDNELPPYVALVNYVGINWWGTKLCDAYKADKCKEQITLPPSTDVKLGN